MLRFNSYNRHNQFALLSRISLTLSFAILVYYALLLDGLLAYILYSYKAVVDKFLLVGQHLHFCLKGSIWKHHLWVHPYISSSVPKFLFALSGWEVGGRIAALLRDVVSQNPKEFCASHLPEQVVVCAFTTWFYCRILFLAQFPVDHLQYIVLSCIHLIILLLWEFFSHLR